MAKLLDVPLAAIAIAIGTTAGWSPALAAPGEDTIVLKGPVTYTSLPGAPQPTSGGMDSPAEIPASMRSRITRYVAKAYSATAADGSIYTDSDVVTTVEVR